MSSIPAWIKSPRAHLAVVLVYLLVALGYDLITPRGFTDWAFYLIGVLLTMRFPGRRSLIIVAGVASAFTVVGFALSPPGQPIWMSAFSRSLGLFLIWLSVVIAVRWRRADERLARLQKAVEGAGEIVFMTDREGIITYINPAFTAIYGYLPEEVVGKVTPRILKSGKVPLEEYKSLWTRLLAQRPLRWEIVNKTKDGKFLTVEAAESAIIDEQGKITGFLAVQRDITERKRTEEAIRKSQASLAEAQRISHIGSWDWDVLRDQAWWSEEMYRIFGMDPLGRVPTLESSLMLMHPDDRGRVEAAVKAATDEKKPYELDYRIVRPDGTVRVVHAQGEVFFDEAQKPVRMTGVAQDITERKQAEDELRRLNRALRTISECNQALVRANDEAGLLKTLCQILVDHGGFRMAWVGYAEQDKDQSVRPVAVSGADDGYVERLRLSWADTVRGHGPTGTALRTGQPTIARVIQDDPNFAPWKEEALRRGFASCIALPLLADGRTLGALTVYSKDQEAFDANEVGLLSELCADLAFGVVALRNRDERERTEEALQRTQEQFLQAQKMEAVGRLAGGVAHDFNNLLTVINGYADLLFGVLPKSSEESIQVEEIRKAGERAATLTRQLLAFSRKQIVVPTVLELNAVVSGMQNLLRRLIGEDIEYVEKFSRPHGRVRADAGQIEQVMMNLVINARDAMPKGGKLVVETSSTELDNGYVRNYPYVSPGPYVMLAVSDTGCGMDAETLSHIFEPFFTTKGQGKGTGLGLSTVYGIVKQCGGHVNVYSEVGKGTTFRIYFPRVDEPLPEETSEPDESLSLAGTETVLLVEDEPGVRALAKEILESNGYTVLAAGEYVEALARSTQHAGTIDLLLTDVIMPGLSGKELAECLSGLRPGLKVLFVSGYTADAIAQHGILDEGVAYLSKPFTSHSLLRKVRQILDGTRG